MRQHGAVRNGRRYQLIEKFYIEHTFAAEYTLAEQTLPTVEACGFVYVDTSNAGYQTRKSSSVARKQLGTHCRLNKRMTRAYPAVFYGGTVRRVTQNSEQRIHTAERQVRIRIHGKQITDIIRQRPADNSESVRLFTAQRLNQIGNRSALALSGGVYPVFEFTLPNENEESASVSAVQKSDSPAHTVLRIRRAGIVGRIRIVGENAEEPVLSSVEKKKPLKRFEQAVVGRIAVNESGYHCQYARFLRQFFRRDPRRGRNPDKPRKNEIGCAVRSLKQRYNKKKRKISCGKR